MPKPKKTNIESRLNFGLGGLSVSQEFSHDEFSITAPEFEETNKLQVTIRGLGLQKNWKVLLINELLENRCYLQQAEGKPTSKGEWKVITKFNESSSGAERTIYAIAIKDEDVETVRKLLDPINVIKTISDVEDTLWHNKIKFQISLGKPLIYRKDASAKVAEKNVLYDEKNESMSVGPRIVDGVGGLFSGSYKVLHFSKSDIGKFLNITVESHGHHLWIEIFRGAYNGVDVNGWQARRKEVYRSGGSKINPSLKWKISDAGEYTVYFVRHNKEGEKARYDISYKIEVESNP